MPEVYVLIAVGCIECGVDQHEVIGVYSDEERAKEAFNEYVSDVENGRHHENELVKPVASKHFSDYHIELHGVSSV